MWGLREFYQSQHEVPVNRVWILITGGDGDDWHALDVSALFFSFMRFSSFPEPSITAFVIFPHLQSHPWTDTQRCQINMKRSIYSLNEFNEFLENAWFRGMRGLDLPSVGSHGLLLLVLSSSLPTVSSVSHSRLLVPISCPLWRPSTEHKMYNKMIWRGNPNM